MLQIILIQPGATDFDEQGRIKGTLDIPLNENGAAQVEKTRLELSDTAIDAIYTSPCKCSVQTAKALGKNRDIKIKTLDKLKNLNHGLWHGKLIKEVKQQQPKVYRKWQDRPETVCPPEGESFAAAQERGREVVAKLTKKHQDGIIAIVAPEPLAHMLSCQLNVSELGDLWKAECGCGHWELIQVGPQQAIV